MATSNPLWGAPRIHGELRVLGVDVSERTVSRLLTRHPRRPSQTCRTFLTNHLASAVLIDLFTVPTLTGRVLFVLVVLSHLRRRIVHVNVTDHPTATWAAQQVVDAFPERHRAALVAPEIETASTATSSSADSRAWVSSTSSPLRRVRGRIRTSNA